MEDDDDDSGTSQQSKQGEEHHLVAVYEAVQGVPPLHINNWRNSLYGSVGISHMNQRDRDGEALAGGSTAYGNRSRGCCLKVHSVDDVL